LKYLKIHICIKNYYSYVKECYCYSLHRNISSIFFSKRNFKSNFMLLFLPRWKQRLLGDWNQLLKLQPTRLLFVHWWRHFVRGNCKGFGAVPFWARSLSKWWSLPLFCAQRAQQPSPLQTKLFLISGRVARRLPLASGAPDLAARWNPIRTLNLPSKKCRTQKPFKVPTL